MKLDQFFKVAIARYQAQVDREAALDYKLDELRNEATLTAEEICEHIASLTDEQFMQVCEALSEAANGNDNVAALRYMLRLICGDVINRKAQKALEEMQRMGWISVKDRLPEFTGDFGGFALVSEDVVAISKSKGFVFSDYSSEGWCDSDGDELDDVTHWMPLPEPPKDD